MKYIVKNQAAMKERLTTAAVSSILQGLSSLPGHTEHREESSPSNLRSCLKVVDLKIRSAESPADLVYQLHYSPLSLLASAHVRAEADKESQAGTKPVP